jgi:DNA-binding transcriptional regulator YiaG
MTAAPEPNEYELRVWRDGVHVSTQTFARLMISTSGLRNWIAFMPA